MTGCLRLYITELYCSEMSKGVRGIFGLANRFWGCQKSVLIIEIHDNNHGWMAIREKVLDAGGR